eukprot:gene28212-37119_t
MTEERKLVLAISSAISTSVFLTPTRAPKADKSQPRRTVKSVGYSTATTPCDDLEDGVLVDFMDGPVVGLVEVTYVFSDGLRILPRLTS